MLTRRKLRTHCRDDIVKKVALVCALQKITSKNAFGLHLIDYMSELLKKKEMNNFQARRKLGFCFKNQLSWELTD